MAHGVSEFGLHAIWTSHMRFLRTESRPQQPRPLKLAQRRDRIRGLELVGMCYADPTTHRPPQTDKKLGRSMRRHLDSQPLPSLKASIPSHTACALYHGACGQSSDACTAPPQRSQAAAEDIILPSTESQSPRVCSTGPVASSRSWRHHPARAFHGPQQLLAIARSPPAIASNR